MAIPVHTDNALKAIFDESIQREQMAEHLHLLTILLIAALQQLEGSGFVKGFLQGAMNDIDSGKSYRVGRLDKQKVH